MNNDVLWRRWDEIDRLFEAALDQPLHERERFVAAQCDRDLELMRTVLDLLAATRAPASSLDKPGDAILHAVWTGDDASVEPGAPLNPGDAVGPYRITREIGRGGMATVYEAERADGAFERRVALKVIRRGIDTDDVVRRFVAERQILSGLTHPHIARMLDGGTTGDGRPFLVMDLVEGEAITTWCDRNRCTVRQRLELFLQVADAVAHAHQHLIVHRDLKPGNILVTADGRAKLLDFGIAKLLEADIPTTQLTRAGHLVLTPEYASPEQRDGETITTASDVYQLGLLLHVLLTGTRPSDTVAGRNTSGGRTRPSSLTQGDASLANVLGTTHQALSRALRGDLDTILLKALRDEPEHRYASVLALAADVRRHLAGHPIAARPPSVAYRMRKFSERNRWFLPAAMLLVFALGGFVATRLRFEQQLERERIAAQNEAERAQELKDFLIEVFRSADPYTPADPERGRDITVVEALDLGAQRARTELDDRPTLQADILAAIAGAYENLSQFDAGLELATEALAIRRANGETSTPQYAEELGLRGRLIAPLSLDSAAAMHRQRLALERQLFGNDHPRVAETLMWWRTESSGEDWQDALVRLDEAIRILRAAGPEHRTSLADALAFRSDATRGALGSLAEAEADAREALEIQREIYGDDDPRTATQGVHLAQTLHAMMRLDEALEMYRVALDVLERKLGPDHSITLASANNMAIVANDAEDYVTAEEVTRRILESRLRVYGPRHPNVAASLQNLASVMLRMRRYQEADSIARLARETYREVLPPTHFQQAYPEMILAEIALLQDRPAEAERAARAALSILEPTLPDGHYATETARCRLARALAMRQPSDDAERMISRALASLESNEHTPPRYLRECGEALAEMHDAAGLSTEAAAVRTRLRAAASKRSGD